MESHHIWCRSINIIYSTVKQQWNVYMLERKKEKRKKKKNIRSKSTKGVSILGK
jgi:hypothetical protein